MQFFTLENEYFRAQLCDYGAALTSLKRRRRDGSWAELLRGSPSPEQRLQDQIFYGVILGRCANRLACATYENHKLVPNEGVHHLHGGPLGYHKRSFTIRDGNRQSQSFGLIDPAGCMGYPGEVRLQVRYRLEDWGLGLDFEAQSSARTILNLSHHPYWNLDPAAQTIAEHKLQLFSDHWTPVDSSLIPSGEIRAVNGTAFDFRQAQCLGERLDPLPPELQSCGGYDHNYIWPDRGWRRMARLISARSALSLDIWSDKQGLQVYTSNGDAPYRDFAGRPLCCHAAICLEPQAVPDAVHHPNFINPVLEPGSCLHETIEYHVEDLS